MTPPRGIRRLFRLRDVRRDVAADTDEELRYHLDRLADEMVAGGLSRSEAEAAARRRFGDVDAYRRALAHIDGGRERTMRKTEVVETMARSLGYAVRVLARSPGFTLSVVTILALGLGANAVMFGVVDRLLLSPPAHIGDPDQVRLVYAQRRFDDGTTFVGSTFTYADYADLAEVSAFASVAAWAGPNEETLGRGEGARPVRVASATASLFPLLEVSPAMGRPFGEEEARPGAPGTALVSWELWDRVLGRDPRILGRTLDLGSGSYTVVGVLPRGFTGAALEPVDVWVPLEMHQERMTGTTIWREHRNWWWLHVVARLADGSATEAAAAQATAAHRRGREEMIALGDYDAEADILVAPVIAARGPRPADEARVAAWLAAVSAIVLLIACFNVANLLLARTARRRREMAVRVALGVGRARLLMELLAQSFVLAALGAVGALVLARAGGSAIQEVLLPDVVLGSPLSSGRLLGFVGLAALLTALLAGVVPALQAMRSAPAGALKGDGSEGRHPGGRTRTGFLVAQATLSVILLVGAGLFVKSLRNARSLDLGFDAGQVVVAKLQWNETLPSAERESIYRRGLDQVRGLPGVRVAGLSYSIPFANSFSLGEPRVPGMDSVPRPPDGGPYVNKVSSGYFEAMAIRVLQGRAFEPGDDADGAPPVAVVTAGMARGYWPEGGAVGACLLVPQDDVETPPCTEVVGVVEDHRRQDLVEETANWLYYVNLPHPAFRGPPQAMMVGTDGDADRLVAPVQASLRETSPLIRFVSAQSLQGNVDPQLRSWTLGASMFSAFGILALVVAGWGLYSVLAFEVASRRRELGIRSALGAGAPRLWRMVLGRSVGVVAVGVGLGLVLAALAAPRVGPLLFTVSPWDGSVYAAVGAALQGVAVLAGTLPAWRATRVDPREALQSE